MSAARPWLVSARFDTLVLMGPVWLAVAVALLWPVDVGLSPLLWLAVVVGIDVAHVYASLYRTYLDPEERVRRPTLYWGTPLACLVVLVAMHAISPALMWTLMAYLAVFHFVRQQWGLSAVYRLNEGQPGRGWDARLERWSIYAVTGFPIVWWHVHLPRDFAWFLEGDFLVGLPGWVLWPVGVVSAVVVGSHIWVRVRSRMAAPGRDLWLMTTAVAWFVGIVWTNGDVPFTLTNVVLHGVPYFALVALVCHRRWHRTGVGVLRPGWFLGLGLLGFVGLLGTLALIESGLWDVLVWHDHPMFFGHHAPPAWLSTIAVPLLAVPQVTHYILDAYIWKLDDSNPGLRSLLLPEVSGRSALVHEPMNDVE